MDGLPSISLNPTGTAESHSACESLPEFDPYEPHWDRRVLLGEPPFVPYSPSETRMVCEPHKGRYDRGYLPHIDLPLVQFVTFRLHDSFPRHLLDLWKTELDSMDENERRRETYRRTESFVDAGHGSCWLRKTEIALVVEGRLHYRDGELYDLLAWTLMPNHVHALVRLYDGSSLPKVIQSWKARSALRANELLGRKGRFWYRDYFDRYIRDEVHFDNCLRYIDMNPVKAGLCREASDWRWGSARFGKTVSFTPSATRRSQ